MNKRYIGLNEHKQILLELLLEFDNFCRKNNIKYFLCGGTLIGAIRHNGFIPWDDDIDICLLRDDYEKLIKIYKPINPNCTLLSLETDKKYNYPFAKLIDNRTILVEKCPGTVEMGVYIDVFPFDNCPGKTKEEGCKFLDKFKWIRWLRDFKVIVFTRERKIYKNIILLFGKIITMFISRRKISEKISKKAKKYMKINGKYVCGIVNNTYGYGEVLDRELFKEAINVRFENLTVCVPVGYDTILSSMYGEYMKFPPEEKRKSHHDFECWYK